MRLAVADVGAGVIALTTSPPGDLPPWRNPRESGGPFDRVVEPGHHFATNFIAAEFMQ